MDRCEEDALTADEKRDQIAQLDELAHKIEVAEEALVVRAHEAGIDVHRRADVDPRIVLGLEPATVRAAARAVRHRAISIRKCKVDVPANVHQPCTECAEGKGRASDALG